MKKFFLIFILIFTLTENVHGEIIVTTDGRSIELKSDGTFEIIKTHLSDGYNEIDMVDLALDGKSWMGKKVKIKGHISSDMTKDFGIYQRSSMVGLRFSGINSGIPKDQIRFALKKCTVLCRHTYVLGEVIKFREPDNSVTINVHSVIFPSKEWLN